MKIYEYERLTELSSNTQAFSYLNTQIPTKLTNENKALNGLGVLCNILILSSIIYIILFAKNL